MSMRLIRSSPPNDVGLERRQIHSNSISYVIYGVRRSKGFDSRKRALNLPFISQEDDKEAPFGILWVSLRVT